MTQRYSKVPKNIRFDDVTLQLFEQYNEVATLNRTHILKYF